MAQGKGNVPPPPPPTPPPGLSIGVNAMVVLVFGLFYGVKKLIKRN